MHFGPPDDWAPVDSALNTLDHYGDLAFTSPRAAAALLGRGAAQAMRGRQGENGPTVWAGGPTTRAALGDALGPVRTPSEGQTALLGAGEALARAMLDARISGPVLFPCGDLRRDDLPGRLRSHSIVVDEVVCYRSMLASESAAQIAAGRGTVLVVASPTVADLLARACSREGRPDLLAVGPTTAAAARASGWPPVAVASMPTVGALVTAVRDVVARHRS
jgi:uroporphyrinogen-III synthase